MSQSLIRKALEKKLAALSPNIATAYENVSFTPVAGTPYQRITLMPNDPDNSQMGSASYIARGIFQVTLCYPTQTGPASAETQAQIVQAHFKRGTALAESGIFVVVTHTPKQHPAMIDLDRYCIPLSILYQAQIST